MPANDAPGTEPDAPSRTAEAPLQAQRRSGRSNRTKSGRRAFAVGAVVGAVVAFIMPEEWSNLAYSPLIAAWLIVPSFFVYAALCIVTFTDFISNDGANPHWLDALWTFSIAVVMGGYGLVLWKLTRLIKGWRGPSGEAE